MLSVSGRNARTRTFTPRSFAADSAPTMAAAPPMSPFIPIMPSVGLIDRPPASNVMPLPTSATVAFAAVAGS